MLKILSSRRELNFTTLRVLDRTLYKPVSWQYTEFLKRGFQAEGKSKKSVLNPGQTIMPKLLTNIIFSDWLQLCKADRDVLLPAGLALAHLIISKCKFANHKCKTKNIIFGFPWTCSLINTTRWTRLTGKAVFINKSRQFCFSLSSPNFQLNVRTREWTPLKRGKTTTSFTNLSFSKDIKLVLIKHQQEHSSFYSVLV